MASLATNDNDDTVVDQLKSLAITRQRTTNAVTIEALQQTRAPPPIKIGILVLPAGVESACGIMLNMFQYLDIRTVCNVKRSSLIQQCRKAFGSDDFERVRDVALRLDYEGRRSINELRLTHPARRLYLLIERYKREFPRGKYKRDNIPIPIICACEYGRMDDVQSFVNLHPYHKYITNRDANGYRDDMTLKEMVNQFGIDSEGGALECTPLIIAVTCEHFQVVQYLIEQGEADPNITDSDGQNALYYAAIHNRKNTEVTELLLEHISLESINKKQSGGCTPLDCAYFNRGPIRLQIAALLRLKGGKSNWFDANGIMVGDGNGDLNH